METEGYRMHKNVYLLQTSKVVCQLVLLWNMQKLTSTQWTFYKKEEKNKSLEHHQYFFDTGLFILNRRWVQCTRTQCNIFKRFLMLLQRNWCDLLFVIKFALVWLFTLKINLWTILVFPGQKQETFHDLKVSKEKNVAFQWKHAFCQHKPLKGISQHRSHYSLMGRGAMEGLRWY